MLFSPSEQTGLKSHLLSRRTQVAVTFLIQKTHLCGCVTMGKRKRKNNKKEKMHFFFLGSYQSPANTLTGQWSVLCRKRQKFLQVHMTLLIHTLLVCVFNILVFSLQRAVNFCLFLLYKENLYWTPVGVSLLMIRVFILSSPFLFLKVHLCTLFLIFLP